MSLNLHSFILFLVRHGETAANKARVLQGQIEVNLNAVGKKQAELLGDYFKNNDKKFDLIYSSSLNRAYDTCVNIVGEENSDKIKVNKLLVERGFGKQEGKPIEIFKENAKKAGFENEVNKYTPEGGEKYEAFYERIKSFCKNQLAHDVKPNYNVLVVCHGNVIREFNRFFKNELKVDYEDLKPFVVTPNTGVNVFNICYKDKKLLRGQCLDLHNVQHLENFDFSSLIDDDKTFVMKKMCVNMDSIDKNIYQQNELNSTL